MSHLPHSTLNSRLAAAGPRRACRLALAAMLGVLGACDGGGGGSATDPTLTQSASPGGSDAAALYQDAAGGTLGDATNGGLTPAVIGAPGQTVNCANALPCRWIGIDSGFAVTVLRADNTGRDGRLELQLEIATTHDTAVGVSLAAAAIDNVGRSAAAVRVTLGETQASGVRALPAGQRLAARIDFDTASSGTVLPGWSLLLDDNGTARPATFANLPLGPLIGTTVNCGGTLPCTWTSEDNIATVELTAAGGFASERRLHVDFRITTTQPIALLAGSESAATAAGGSTFRVRTQRLGDMAMSDTTSVPLTAATAVAGRADFFRTPSVPAMLESLVLDLYREAPVPRWRPSFANVPALAP